MKKVLILTLTLAMLALPALTARAATESNNCYRVTTNLVALIVANTNAYASVGTLCLRIDGDDCYINMGSTTNAANTGNAIIPKGWSWCWSYPEVPPKYISILPMSTVATCNVFRVLR